MTAPRYPITTLAQMADIPEEAMPRFLAELPAILATMRQWKAAAPDLAEQVRAKAPWWSRWMITDRTTGLAIEKCRRMTWIDDDKGLATVTLAMREGEAPIFERTEKMEPLA